MPHPSKRTVRSALRARRRDLAATRDLAADDRALAEHVVALADGLGLGVGATATLYEAFPEEPPTRAMTAALRARGLRVLVPLTLSDLDLDWADAADPERRPLGLGAIAEVDLLLVPGLAVDAAGTRLGQGGGCYDKALPRRASGREVVVVLHPEEFPAAPLPREPHDVLVHAVLTADGLTRLGRP